jgi:hypothetical protein
MKLDEKWFPNVKFDSNKVKWDNESGSDDEYDEYSMSQNDDFENNNYL